MGASRVDLNSQDSVVPASDPRESSLLLALHPSSEYCEDEDEDGKRRLCSRGGRSDVREGTVSPSSPSGVKEVVLPSPQEAREEVWFPRLGSVITPSCLEH